MKKLLIICALLLGFSGVYFAQDTIRYTTGGKQNAKILEVSGGTIKYKKSDNPNGPVFTVAVSQVSTIVYENGSRDFFNNPVPVPPPAPAPSPVPVVTMQAGPPPHMEDVVRYSGPRLGCTYLGPGTVSNSLTSIGRSPFVTQFGWQFETRIFSSTAGIQGLAEFVPLVAGFEQGLFLPSASLLFGVRGREGFELAVGPTLALSGFGMVFAAGTSFHIDDVYFPVNIAFVPSVGKSYTTVSYAGVKSTVKENTGYRVSLLVGFNTRKK
jgi:hypothetical protein